MDNELADYHETCDKHNISGLQCLASQLTKECITLSDYNFSETDVMCFLESYKGCLVTLNILRTTVSRRLMEIISKFLEDKLFLRNLNLENCQFNCRMKTLFDSLAGHNLSNLNLSGIELSTEGMTWLVNLLDTLEDLVSIDLSHSSIDNETARILANFLGKNSSIESINLGWNKISDEGGMAVANVFKTNRGIKVINLSMNGIGDRSCRAFATSLPMNTKLEYLDLSKNQINKKCLNFLLNGLYGNSSIINLNLTGNPMEGQSSVMIARMLLKSTKSAITCVEIENLSVNQEFENLYARLKEEKHVRILYERKNFGTIAETKEEVGILDSNPMLILAEFMKQKKFRVIDFFKLTNTGKDGKITKDELKIACNKFKINFNEHAINQIFRVVDKNSDEKISYEELQVAVDNSKKRINELKRLAGKNLRNEKLLSQMDQNVKQILRSKHKY